VQRSCWHGRYLIGSRRCSGCSALPPASSPTSTFGSSSGNISFDHYFRHLPIRRRRIHATSTVCRSIRSGVGNVLTALAPAQQPSNLLKRRATGWGRGNPVACDRFASATADQIRLRAGAAGHSTARLMDSFPEFTGTPGSAARATGERRAW